MAEVGDEMRSVYVSIGNSDDKLTQVQWSAFQMATDATLRDHADAVHGAWVSEARSRWQNACWCIQIASSWEEPLRARLASLAAHYHQDSIAWAVAEVEFVEARRG